MLQVIDGGGRGVGDWEILLCHNATQLTYPTSWNQMKAEYWKSNVVCSNTDLLHQYENKISTN